MTLRSRRLRDLLSARIALVVLTLLLALKMTVTAWNAVVYDARQVDQTHHTRRAEAGGLHVTRMTYDSPLYYLPTLITKHFHTSKVERRVSGAALLRDLRYTNILYMFAFYASWIYVVFPRLLPNHATSFVASVLLLGLPGYQRLAAFAHADNALAALTALFLAIWLIGRDKLHRFHQHSATTGLPARRGTGAIDWRWLLGVAFVAGVVGLTRPLAAAPVAVFWFACVALATCGYRIGSLAFLARTAVVTAIIGVLSCSWHVYRLQGTGTVLNPYAPYYHERYGPRKKDFDAGHYVSSFYFGALLKIPNRNVATLDKGQSAAKNRYANSFFTMLYSETWGDHWLYFSGSNNKEQKLWLKRIAFVVALPLVLLLMMRLGGSTLYAAARARWDDEWRHRVLVLGAYLGLGVALYLYWQMGSGLTPGKNSSIKFIYNAHLYPAAIAACFLAPLRVRSFVAWSALASLVFLVTFPLSVFWPSW